MLVVCANCKIVTDLKTDEKIICKKCGNNKYIPYDTIVKKIDNQVISK